MAQALIMPHLCLVREGEGDGVREGEGDAMKEGEEVEGVR